MTKTASEVFFGQTLLLRIKGCSASAMCETSPGRGKDYCTCGNVPHTPAWSSPRLRSPYRQKARRDDSVVDLLCKVLGRLPNNEVVVVGIEMNLVEPIVFTTPNNWDSQPLGEACLEIDATSIASKIRHYETASSDLGNNPIIDPIVVL